MSHPDQLTPRIKQPQCSRLIWVSLLLVGMAIGAILLQRVKTQHDSAAKPRQSNSAVDKYNDYVENLIQRLLAPSKRYKGYTYPKTGLTMQSKHTLLALKRQIENVVDNSIDGDIYETGTWRAGTSIFMVAVFRAYAQLTGRLCKRHFYFFDSFEGFKAEGIDTKLDQKLSSKNYVAPLDIVCKSFEDFGFGEDDHIHFVKGFFEQTVPKFEITSPIALLRLDGDLYSSTKVVLDHFYRHVAIGGWVVIDDYTWRPKLATSRLCKEAVDDFRQEHNIKSVLTTKYGKHSWQITPNLEDFKDQFQGGGMTRVEQELLADTYSQSESVFEWGMGSSTLIAEHMGIQRLTAVDSASVWVKTCRTKVRQQYKLVHVNIGDVKKFGNPKDESRKEQWPDYSTAVSNETEPFDVYLIDGRFRVACALQAFLHGTNTSLVLIHDFQRPDYQPVLDVANVVRRVGQLVVLQKKASVTTKTLTSLWEKYKYVQN